MKKFSFLIITIAVFTSILTSCKRTESIESIADAKVLFSYEANSYHVQFHNESSMHGTYLWDFGDNTTSTEENPSHDYTAKGIYYVTLTVTDGDNKDSVFTKIRIDKSSNIDLNDNSFADWQSIDDAYIPNPQYEHGVVTHFKYDYDSDYIYFYLEVDTPSSTDGQIFDMLIDVDPSQTTGFPYSIWPNFGGGEILIENGFSANRVGNDDYFLDFATYDPTGTDWDTKWIYDENNTEGAQIDGTYQAQGTTIKIEFAVSRTLIPALNGVDIIKIVAWTSDPNWDENGWIPGKMPDNPAPNTPPADGLIINMQ